MKKLLKIAAALILILVGVVGLIMPVMPGWVFIIAGLVILAEYSKTANSLLEWGKTRFEKATGRPVRKTASAVPDGQLQDR